MAQAEAQAQGWCHRIVVHVTLRFLVASEDAFSISCMVPSRHRVWHAAAATEHLAAVRQDRERYTTSPNRPAPLCVARGGARAAAIVALRVM